MGTELINAFAQAGQALISSPALEGLLTALLTTLFIRHDSKTKAFEEMKGQNFAEVTKKLLADGKMSYLEYYKCKNFYDVAQKADQYLHEDNQADSTQEKMDFDWFMRFFDSVGTISNEELQDLWAKVLAAEVSSPKSCSLRTLDIIRNLSAEEAKVFQLLCNYIIISGSTAYIDASGFHDIHDGHIECNEFISNIGMNYSDSVLPLIEAGIFSDTHDISIYLSKTMQPLMILNEKFFCSVAGINDEPDLFTQDAYILTSCGKELYRVAKQSPDFNPDLEYNRLCFEELQKNNPHVEISMFAKISDDEFDKLI